MQINMSNLVKCIAGILCCVLFEYGMVAQTAARVAPGGKFVGVKHYTGRIDDINDVTISMKCHNKNCEGELVYLRSRDRFQLKGTLNDNRLNLREFNRTKLCTGYLTGKLEGDRLTLDWKNLDGSIGNELQLKEVSRTPDFPTFCGDNKWINAYSGKINGELIELVLQRVENNRILGTAFSHQHNLTYRVEGSLLESNNLHITLTDINKLITVGTIRGIFKENQHLRTSYYDRQQMQSFVTFKLEQSVDMSCLEYADYYTNYDFLFPKSNSAIFNEYMVLLTNKWISDCRSNAKEIRRKEASVDARASQRAYSWTDVAFLSENFISGMLTYHASWRGKEETKTFNFDLKKGEIILLEDLFKKGFDYRIFLKKYAAEQILRLPIYKRDKDFRNWVKDQKFEHFTIGKTGISLYTDFHIIYGRQQVFIPYKKIKSNIKKNATVRKLF